MKSTLNFIEQTNKQKCVRKRKKKYMMFKILILSVMFRLKYSEQRRIRSNGLTQNVLFAKQNATPN